MGAKSFDKAIIVHRNEEHTIALVGKKDEDAPSGIGFFKNGPPIEEGKPLVGDTIFNRCEDGTFDVTHLPQNHHSKEDRCGPAQVASPQYRTNYDRIFGQKNLNMN